MKITILGAAGVRTPILVKALSKLQNSGLEEISLMDIDNEHLNIIEVLIDQQQSGLSTREFNNIEYTTDARKALLGANYVITTFRVGGMEGRVIDESVPLEYGVLGQETTGAGGFAMAARSIPVLEHYVKIMEEVCPEAWIINFANPSGILTEYLINGLGWEKSVGICDAPASMHTVIARLLNSSTQDVFIDYFGLNHLGWIKSIQFQGEDVLPDVIRHLNELDDQIFFPFKNEFIEMLGLIPNEYLFYYYSSKKAVANISLSGITRAEYLLNINRQLFSDLTSLMGQKLFKVMFDRYKNYMIQRSSSYMMIENSEHRKSGISDEVLESPGEEGGYGHVARKIIESLQGDSPGIHIMNVRNLGAIPCMSAEDVVEVPTFVSKGSIRPLHVGSVPDHCLGLMKQLKAFEKETISSVINKDYKCALKALTTHPLIQDDMTARAILDQYISKHGSLFPGFNK
jgi:6-phospho-beta-glucosidase